MATAYLRAESTPVILPDNLTHAAALLSQLDREQIAGAIEVLMALMDLSETDCDLEDNADAEQASWRNAPGQLGLHSGCMAWDHDDAEDDDPGGCEHDGREPEAGVLCAHYGIDQTKGPNTI